MEFIFANQNTPFAVSLSLMFLIALLEGITTLLGAGLSGVLDSLLPEMDMDLDVDVDVDMDVDVDVDAPHIPHGSALTRILGWMRFGQVPALVLMVIFLTAFGLIGYILQSVVLDIFGHMLPALPASGLAFLCAIPFVRVGGGILAKIIPKDETDAVAEQSFIGLIAVITLGTAKSGSAAQGKLKDRFGQTHYIMIQPDDSEESFPQGTEVLLVRQEGAVFRAIRNTSAVLGSKNDPETE